jgi:hypothetical protein
VVLGEVVGLGHGPGTDVVVVTIVGLGLSETVMLGTATRLGLIRVTVGNGYGARISDCTGDGPGARLGANVALRSSTRPCSPSSV